MTTWREPRRRRTEKRDPLSPVLQELDTMLQAMRCALFQPDRTRSGMVTPSVMPDVPGTPFRVPPVPSTPGPQNQPEMSEKDSQHEDFGWKQVGGERDIFSPVESVVSLAQPKFMPIMLQTPPVRQQRRLVSKVHLTVVPSNP